LSVGPERFAKDYVEAQCDDIIQGGLRNEDVKLEKVD